MVAIFHWNASRISLLEKNILLVSENDTNKFRCVQMSVDGTRFVVLYDDFMTTLITDIIALVNTHVRLLALADSDGSVTFLKQNQAASFSDHFVWLDVHNEGILCMAGHNKNNRNMLITGSSDGIIHISDWAHSNKDDASIASLFHGKAVRAITCTDKYIISASVGLKIWKNDATHFPLQHHLPNLHGSHIISSLMVIGDIILTADKSGYLIFTLVDSQTAKSFVKVTTASNINDVALLPKGNIVIGGTSADQTRGIANVITPPPDVAAVMATQSSIIYSEQTTTISDTVMSTFNANDGDPHSDVEEQNTGNMSPVIVTFPKRKRFASSKLLLQENNDGDNLVSKPNSSASTNPSAQERRRNSVVSIPNVEIEQQEENNVAYSNALHKSYSSDSLSSMSSDPPENRITTMGQSVPQNKAPHPPAILPAAQVNFVEETGQRNALAEKNLNIPPPDRVRALLSPPICSLTTPPNAARANPPYSSQAGLYQPNTIQRKHDTVQQHHANQKNRLHRIQNGQTANRHLIPVHRRHHQQNAQVYTDQNRQQANAEHQNRPQQVNEQQQQPISRNRTDANGNGPRANAQPQYRPHHNEANGNNNPGSRRHPNLMVHQLANQPNVVLKKVFQKQMNRQARHPANEQLQNLPSNNQSGRTSNAHTSNVVKSTAPPASSIRPPPFVHPPPFLAPSFPHNPPPAVPPGSSKQALPRQTLASCAPILTQNEAKVSRDPRIRRKYSNSLTPPHPPQVDPPVPPKLPLPRRNLANNFPSGKQSEDIISRDPRIRKHSDSRQPKEDSYLARSVPSENRSGPFTPVPNNPRAFKDPDFRHPKPVSDSDHRLGRGECGLHRLGNENRDDSRDERRGHDNDWKNGRHYQRPSRDDELYRNRDMGYEYERYGRRRVICDRPISEHEHFPSASGRVNSYIRRSLSPPQRGQRRPRSPERRDPGYSPERYDEYGYGNINRNEHRSRSPEHRSRSRDGYRHISADLDDSIRRRQDFERKKDTTHVWIPISSVSAVLGPKGNIIRKLRRKSGAIIWIDNTKVRGDTKLLEIKGGELERRLAEELVTGILDRNKMKEKKKAPGGNRNGNGPHAARKDNISKNEMQIAQRRNGIGNAFTGWMGDVGDQNPEVNRNEKEELSLRTEKRIRTCYNLI